MALRQWCSDVPINIVQVENLNDDEVHAISVTVAQTILQIISVICDKNNLTAVPCWHSNLRLAPRVWASSFQICMQIGVLENKTNMLVTRLQIAAKQREKDTESIYYKHTHK